MADFRLDFGICLRKIKRRIRLMDPWVKVLFIGTGPVPMSYWDDPSYLGTTPDKPNRTLVPMPSVSRSHQYASVFLSLWPVGKPALGTFKTVIASTGWHKLQRVLMEQLKIMHDPACKTECWFS